jgi:hypothetical protein
MRHVHIRGSQPNDNKTKLVSEGYDLRRGKVVPVSRRVANSGGTGAMGPVDMDAMNENGKRLLDEALK